MTAAGVAVLALIVLVVVVVAFAQVLRQLSREHARERQLLINQVLHLSGQTWQPPPADERRPEPDEPLVEYAYPSQLPV